MQKTQVWSLGWEDLLEKEMGTHSSILAWEFHGQRSLVDYSPWGDKRSDVTEQLTLFHFKCQTFIPPLTQKHHIQIKMCNNAEKKAPEPLWMSGSQIKKILVEKKNEK